MMALAKFVMGIKSLMADKEAGGVAPAPLSASLFAVETALAALQSEGNVSDVALQNAMGFARALATAYPRLEKPVVQSGGERRVLFSWGEWNRSSFQLTLSDADDAEWEYYSSEYHGVGFREVWKKNEPVPAEIAKIIAHWHEKA